VSQEIVLEKKIDFQGCEVTMRSVLQRHGNVEDVLGPELVTDMITEEIPVNIGGRLQVNTGYYAVRVLERNVYLRLDILKDVDLLRHVFVVSGMRENDLSEFAPSRQTVQTFSYSCKNGVLCDKANETDSPKEVGFIRIEGNDLETCYSVLCEMHSEKTLHWVEFKNRNFLWIRSNGATDNLLNYVDYGRTRLDPQVVTEYMKNPIGGINEEVIWKLNERTVLVVDEPGMGKSSTTTQVAWHTKSADPTSWVVRINWNDHTRKLQEINTATFNFDSLVEFLCSAAFTESKYTDINKKLLKQAVQNSGNVTVLMDGFDEISPIHADKAAAVLSELMKTKVERVWVTSRPVQKEKLEKDLSVTAYGMRKLSFVSQEDMLIVIWKSKADGAEIRKCRLHAFINDLLRELNDLFYEDNFTGCPLYVAMIAIIYDKDVDICLNSEDWIRPRIDLVNLYEKFVERKLHIYLTQKQKADTTNSCVQDDHEDLKHIYLKNFEKCALVAILPPTLLKSLHNKQIEKEIELFLGRVQAGKDKRGVVMNVIEGKPYFVHRTFAEYFTARWFSRNFESNRRVLEGILFDPEYGFVRYMFDRILAKGSALPLAVLQEDMKCAETLLKEGSNVKVVDKGGRTLMHLFAARSRRDGHYNTHITDFIHNVSHYEASLHNTDSVLQWTPLQYAIKSENWSIVERLLENNVDKSGLDMIRQRAHDAHYIDRIIIHAARYGHLLLLEFLCSNGANFHQVSSKGFHSPLHAAIHEEELSVIRLLIQHGADCNTRYSDGQTPLFYAVTKGSLDVVRLLVEEGGASVDICDDHGRTVINWINNYTSYLEDSDIIRKEYKLERLNEIVKYLQERGYK
jgi:ankyrin repeat protein